MQPLNDQYNSNKLPISVIFLIYRADNTGTLDICMKKLNAKNIKLYKPRHQKTCFFLQKICFFAYAKTKIQISFTVTTKLIGTFVYAT